jgi:hypothetical protein
MMTTEQKRVLLHGLRGSAAFHRSMATIEMSAAYHKTQPHTYKTETAFMDSSLAYAAEKDYLAALVERDLGETT